MASPDPGLSLYVHVPFCTDKCLYCDFFSVPRRTVSSPVLAGIMQELVLMTRAFLEAADGPAVPTIFIGGGTPSCLPPAEFRALLSALQGLGAREWTVESNPETLSESFLDACAAAGVTRISVGIQSLRTELLKTLRRRATREQALAAIDLLRRRWRGEVNLDFITGIPGQKADEVTGDLDVIDTAWPDHVSLYQLTVEPGTPLEAGARDGSIQLNRPEVDEELWLAGREELERRGFRQYEVSNFARPARECRHNLRYWRIDPYAGAGPGAVSTLPAAWAARFTGRPELEEKGPVIRLSSPKSIDSFLQGKNRSWGTEAEVVSSADFLLETLMMGLRLSDGVRDELLQSRFGCGLGEIFPGLWEQWVSAGNAAPFDGTWRLTSAGLMILDYLLGKMVDRLPRDLGRGALRWPP